MSTLVGMFCHQNFCRYVADSESINSFHRPYSLIASGLYPPLLLAVEIIEMINSLSIYQGVLSSAWLAAIGRQVYWW